ncbi:MAG: hypothetical protein ACYDDF_07690 [Thermoplasmatota archaeon]
MAFPKIVYALALPAILLSAGCGRAAIAYGATPSHLGDGTIISITLGLPSNKMPGAITDMFGTNHTSAATTATGNSLGGPPKGVLSVEDNSSTVQDCYLLFTSSTGVSRLSSVSIQLGGVTQIAASKGAITQTSGAPQSIAQASAAQVGATVAFTKNAKGQTATFSADIVCDPSGETGQTLVESWTLSAST